MSNPNLDALAPLIAAAQSDFAREEAQVSSLTIQLSDAEGEIAQLTAQVAGLQGGNKPLSPLITQFRNVEAMPGWIWPKGTQGNTGGVGNTGVASYVYDSVAGVANLSIVPTLPKVATANSANYNAYFYNPLAGTNSNNGQPLPFPAIAPKLGIFLYHAEYFVPSAQWGARNAAENEIRWHNGQGTRHIMASQLRIGSSKPTVHIYDWSVSGGDKWVDTGVACNMTPDNWYAIDTVFHADPISGKTDCLGFQIEGQWHPWTHTQPANPYSNKAWFLASVQPDSNTKGDPFSYQVRNLHVMIL
jgi:hypothetical protein